MRFADLHLHTRFSDGTFTPEELVWHAQKHGLACIALTDHDTVEGCDRAAAACAVAGLEFISATELTAELADTEVHIIGYFLDTQNQVLLDKIAKFRSCAAEPDPRNGRRVELDRHSVAGRIGFSLTAGRVTWSAACHARSMVKDGLVSSLDGAF